MGRILTRNQRTWVPQNLYNFSSNFQTVALVIHIHVCNGFCCRDLTLAMYVDYAQQFQMRMIVSLGLLKMSFERAYLLTLYFTEEEIGAQRN